MSCSLKEGVHLAMQATAEFVPLAGGNGEFLAHAADLATVRQSARRAIVAGSEDLLIEDQKGADRPPEAG